jgi:hypothetical protein
MISGASVIGPCAALIVSTPAPKARRNAPSSGPGAQGTSSAKIANLVGLDGAKVAKAKEFVWAVDPVSLTLFLEIGSIVFMSAAFARKRGKGRQELRNSVTLQQETPGNRFEKCPLSRATWESLQPQDQALQDFKAMRSSGSQKFLADRWGVSESASASGKDHCGAQGQSIVSA